MFYRRLRSAGPPEGTAGAAASHVSLIHQFQKGDAEDAWLQIEWARILLALGRKHEAARHLQVSMHLALLMFCWWPEAAWKLRPAEVLRAACAGKAIGRFHDAVLASVR